MTPLAANAFFQCRTRPYIFPLTRCLRGWQYPRCVESVRYLLPELPWPSFRRVIVNESPVHTTKLRTHENN